MRMTLDEVEALALKSLLAAGATEAQALPVARSIRAAERDGMRSHGLLYLPIYVGHLTCGKVDGLAVPRLERPKAGAVCVDAAHGFAHPAIDMGFPPLVDAARAMGIAALTLQRSYNCGLLGHHAERIGAGQRVVLAGPELQHHLLAAADQVVPLLELRERLRVCRQIGHRIVPRA